MRQKVTEFLYEIGFDEDDVRDFFHIENDGFTGDGRPFYGNDIIFAKVMEEEISVDLRETGEIVDAYWENGWSNGFHDFHRSNFDSYKGRYYKAFPTRYKLWQFEFTKSLRRNLRKNSDLKTVIRPLRITPEKSNLYDTYNYLRHDEPPKKDLTEIYKYLSNDDSKKMELCVFRENKLVACSFFEVGAFSMVGNTAFWDIDEKERGLGTFTMLREIEYGLKNKLSYYYLGHFYAQNPAYHYKTRFSGLELYDWDNGYWIDFKLPRIKELLKQKIPRHND